MNDFLIMQVAMEASAMPPPASKANGEKTGSADDASFDSVLEGVMKPQDDADTLALATEAVVIPVQTPVIQPVFDGNEVHVSELDAMATDQMKYEPVGGQNNQFQSDMIVVDHDTKDVEDLVLVQDAPTPSAESTSHNATNAPRVVSVTMAQETPPLANVFIPLLVVEETDEKDISQMPQEVSEFMTEAQSAQEVQWIAQNSEETEQSLPSQLDTELQESLIKDNKGREKSADDFDRDDQTPSSDLDAADKLLQSKPDTKVSGEAGKADIKIDLAKASHPDEQAGDPIAGQPSSTEGKLPEAEVHEISTPPQNPVSESRKVKADIKKIEGESPPQTATAHGAVQSQELEALVKEPARLAEARSPEMINQITKGIELLSRSDGQSLRIQLHPENLGKIDIRIHTGADGVTVALTTDTQLTGNLLERSLSELRTSLADAGINLANLSVNSGQQQAAYQESSQWFSEKGTWKNYYRQDNRFDLIPSATPIFKETAIDYRI